MLVELQSSKKELTEEDVATIIANQYGQTLETYPVERTFRVVTYKISTRKLVLIFHFF